jgi:cobalt-zinc-cadmium efflux system protein
MPDVERRMRSVPGVAAVHDLHVWTVTSGMVAMSGHAIVPDLHAHPDVLESIRVEMARLGISHVTIQLEVEDECAEPMAVGGPDHTHHHHHGGPGHRH